MSVHLCFECNDEIKLTTSHSCIRGLKKGIDRVLMEIQDDFNRRFDSLNKALIDLREGNKNHHPSRAKLEASLAEKNKEIGELRKSIDLQYESTLYWYNQATEQKEIIKVGKAANEQLLIEVKALRNQLRFCSCKLLKTGEQSMGCCL